MAVELPFGFRDPGDADFASLGETILARADRAVVKRTARARLMVPVYLGVYLVFSVVANFLVHAFKLELDTGAFLATISVAFVGLAVLGNYYRSEASWSELGSGLGRMHGMLLAQAWIVRTATAAFFVLPYRALMNVAELFPRPAKIDPAVLQTAVQLAAALDESVHIDDLKGIVPPNAAGPTLEEAILLLVWAEVAENRRGVIAPTDRHRNAMASLPPNTSAVTRISDLRAPRP